MLRGKRTCLAHTSSWTQSISKRTSKQSNEWSGENEEEEKKGKEKKRKDAFC